MLSFEEWKKQRNQNGAAAPGNAPEENTKTQSGGGTGVLSFEDWKKQRNQNGGAATGNVSAQDTKAQGVGITGVMTFAEWREHRKQLDGQTGQPTAAVNPTENANAQAAARAREVVQEYQRKSQEDRKRQVENLRNGKQPGVPEQATEPQEVPAAEQSAYTEGTGDGSFLPAPEDYDDNTLQMFGQITDMNSTLVQQAEELTQTESALKTAADGITQYEQQLEQIKAEYEMNPTNELYLQYEQLYAQYREEVENYNQIYGQYKNLYDQYAPMYADYEKLIQDYETYIGGIKLYGGQENWGAEEYAYVADQAQKAYDAYLQTPEAQAIRNQNMAARAAQTQVPGVYTAPIAGQSTEVQEDTKEAELRAVRDYWRMMAQQAADQETMEVNIAEINKWPKEDREKLAMYAMFQTSGFGSVLGKTLPDYRDLKRKYGKDEVERLSKTLSRGVSAAATELTKQVGEKLGANEAKIARRVTPVALTNPQAMLLDPNLSTIPMNLIGSVTGTVGYLDEAIRGGRGEFSTLDPNNVGNLPSVYASAVRGQIAKDISGDQYDEEGNKVSDGGALAQTASYAYQGLMSAADSMTRAAAGGGNKAVSLGLAAMGSFSQTVSDASARGAAPTQAMMLGVVNAGLEVATEYLQLDEMLKVAKGGAVPAAQMWWNILKQAGIEVTEEEVSFLGALSAEAAILREKSGYNQQIAEAVANGASYEDAVTQANWDVIYEAAETAIISAFSGGASGVASSGTANLNNFIQGKAEAQLPYHPDAHVELADMQVQYDQETWDMCDRLAKATGRNIKLYQHYGPGSSAENGYFEDGVIYVNTRSGDPVAQIVSHELTHSVEFANEYKELSRLVLGRIEATGGDLKQLRQQKADLYAQEGHPLESQDAIDQEIVAEYIAKNLLTNEQQIMEAARQNRPLIERIKGWIDKLLGALGNKDAAERAYLTNVQNLYAKALQQQRSVIGGKQTVTESGKNVSEMPFGDVAQSDETTGAMTEDDAEVNWDDPMQVRTWAQNLLQSGQITDEEFNALIDLADNLEVERLGRESFNEGSGKKYSIETLPDGKKYVRADRQVIMGNDPDSWSEQVEDYINGRIRRGQDVTLIAEDGDVLTLTSTTAGKLADNHTSRGTTMSDDDFYLKANAAVHIDELAKVSKVVPGANRQDVDNRHGEFASGGWTYRTAYFMDFDGKYYRIRISAAKNSDGTIVYNIGDVKERSFPTIDGSSAKRGALGGKTSFERSVSQERGTVKRQYSFAGPGAKTANSQTLAEAKALEEAGVADETIRQQTGWFKGMDSKWRFEVDDSSSRISENVSNYMTLGELLQDAEILEAYPNMADVSVVFQSLPKGVNASYSPQFDTIDVSNTLKGDPEAIRAAVLHEVQHVIQRWEGFTKGTTVESWDRKIKAGFDSRRGEDVRKAQETEREIRRVQQEEPEFYRDMMELDAMTPDGPRGEVNWDTLEQITEDSPEWQAFDARRDELQETYGEAKVWDFMDLLYQQEKAAQSEGRTATELYWDTAGEIEARNTAARRNLTAEERKNTPPMLGDEDTVFAEGSGLSHLIAETDDGRAAVVVDNDILSNINTSSWDSTTKNQAKAEAKKAMLSFKDGIQVSGIRYKVNQDSRKEYTRSEYTEKIYNKAPDVFADKMRAAENVDDIITATTAWARDGGLKHPRKDNFVDFMHGDVLIQAGKNQYKADTVVAITKSGEFVFYDVVDLDPTTFSIKEGSPTNTESNDYSGTAQGDPSGRIVAEDNHTVKRQMSLSSSVSRKNVAEDLRGILSRGGDVTELRQYISQLEQSGGKAEQSGRNADQNGANAERSEVQQIVNMAKRYGLSVEEYLRRNWEQYDVDGRWNEAARKALELERGGRQYSLSDSFDNQGNQLSEGQQEFFAESQVRDENGSLVPVYHTSPTAGFYTFDGAKGEGNYKYGKYEDLVITFFTDSQEMSSSYAKNPRLVNTSRDMQPLTGHNSFSGQYKGYLNIKNPFIIDAKGAAWKEIEIFNEEKHKMLMDLTDEEQAAVRKYYQPFDGDVYGEFEFAAMGREMLNRKPKLFQKPSAEEKHFLRAASKYEDMVRRFNKDGYNEYSIRDIALSELFLSAKRGFDPEKLKARAVDKVTTNQIVRMALEQGGYDGVWIKSVGDYGKFTDAIPDDKLGPHDVYVTFHADQFKAWDNRNPTRAKDIRYSISSTEEQTEPKTAGQIRQEMPAKARNFLQGAQRRLLTTLQEKMGVNKFTNLQDLKGITEEIANVYLTEGTVNPEKMDQLFELAYAGGIVRDDTFYQQYKEIKTHLQNNPVTISEGDSHDIADFADFKRRNFGTLRIVKEGGMPVDSAYHELNTMAPELFPESITHPADQLVRMAEVAGSIQVSEYNLNAYHGSDRENFRKYARHEFENAVADVVGDLRQVKRYMDGSTEQEESVPTTSEEAMEYYKQLKDARRTYEKAQAKNLLTPSDEMQVGKLLRGEILPEDLNPDKDYVKGIMAVYEAKKEYERLSKQIAQYKRTVRSGYRDTADMLLETANAWKDKKVGIAYSRETMERNIDDIVPDKEVAKAIKQEYFESVHIKEAESTRFKTQFRDRVRGMNLSTKIEKGNLVSEAHAVQLLGEAEDNIRVLQEARGRMKARDGKTIEEWRSVVRNLWEESPGLDQEKIRRAVKEFRQIYDELFQRMNAERVRNGYEPVNYRKGYFPHFQPGEGDGILGAFGKALNIDTSVAALPTTINGLTHTFKPGIQWFGNAQERLGFNTAYDAVEGFDKYIEGVSSVIHQTENIQKLRALASQIRYRTSEEGIRKQVDAVMARDNLTDEEKTVQINSIYEHGRFTLSNFVNELDEYTNLLANKKSKLDRTLEAMMGRKVYAVMKAWEARVGANMIAGNLSSAFTNLIPLTQAGAQLDKGSLLKGMAATLKSYKEDDGIVGRSSFLTNRRGSDPLVQTWSQKASGVLGKPMELIDGFTSDSIVRAAYFQNLKRGMSETEALHQADVFAARVMADRSKGAMPTLFESKNPIFKAFTQFQLEVNNQFSEVFKDLPRGHREKGLAALGMVLLKYFLGAFLYNEVYEYFVGRRAALDPFGILNDTVGDLTGYELPNLVEWGANAIRGKETSFETEKVGIGEAGKNLTSNLLGELPFSSGLTLLGIETDGSRIPASSAVPDLTALRDAATMEEWSAEKRWKEAQDELNKLAYVIPPFGGNQIGKLWKGIKAYSQGGSYNVDAEGNDILQYPVFKDSPADAVGNAVRMGIFGKNALPEAQDWVNSGFNSLSAKQTAVYQDMLDAGENDRKAYTLVQKIGSAKNPAKFWILDESDVSDESKAIIYYGMLASKSEQELMDKLADAGAEQGAIGNLMMDMKQASRLKGTAMREAQQKALAEAAMTDEEKAVVVGSLLGTEMVTEKGKPTQYANFLTALDRGLSVDDYMEMRANGVDVEEYLELTDSGIASGKAAELAYDMYDLDGREDVDDAEYWRLIVNSSDNENTQMAMLGTRMSDSYFEKLTTAQKLDVSPNMFVSYYETRAKYDADGNGSYTQAEIKAVIDAMGKNYTNEQKGVLWQMATGSKSTKNNPYSKEAGQKWIDARNAAKEGS